MHAESVPTGRVGTQFSTVSPSHKSNHFSIFPRLTHYCSYRFGISRESQVFLLIECTLVVRGFDLRDIVHRCICTQHQEALLSKAAQTWDGG